MNLTVSYVTSRRDCRIEWFFQSLANELTRLYPTPESHIVKTVILVDRYHDEPNRVEEIRAKFTESFYFHSHKLNHVAAKPSVWSGPHRLTKQDYFTPANYRNTAICLCETEWLAFIDDLSVVMPGWLGRIVEAMNGGYFVAGAYKKVKNLHVSKGIPTFEEYPQGIDNRIRLAKDDVGPCEGGWLYGCAMAGPLEWYLDVGGFPEFCDSTGLGSEDTGFGIALLNRGLQLRYDRRMLTLESEELHHVEPAMLRKDKGVSPSDKSHAALNLAKSSNYFPNYFPGGIREERERVLAGQGFTISATPDTDWYDSQPLSEM